MAFEKIPDKFSSIQILEAALGYDSTFVPTALLLMVNQDKKLALIRGNDRKCLRIPEGTVHRPNPHIQETAANKIIATAQARTNATLGRLARVRTDEVELLPFINRVFALPDQPEAIRWQKAIGRVYMPVLVGVDVCGKDPLGKHETLWVDPVEAVNYLEESIDGSSNLNGPTLSAIGAVHVSLPSIASLAK